eukprot:1871892-Pyramimonas_sp.AAC.1
MRAPRPWAQVTSAPPGTRQRARASSWKPDRSMSTTGTSTSPIKSHGMARAPRNSEMARIRS